MENVGVGLGHRITGVVVRVDGRHVWVEVAPTGSCGSCKTQGECGSGLMGLRAASRQYRLLNSAGASVGDAVTMALPDGGVFRAALLAYILPLLLGLGGAVVGMAAGGSDGLAGLGLLAGLAVGWGLLRYLPAGREPFVESTFKAQVVRLHPRFHEEP